MQGFSGNLKRFVEAQSGVYLRALSELKAGRKETHWMWFIFPQIRGLGFSETSRFYAIQDIQEARQYLAHPILGKRLEECCRALLSVEGGNATQILGSPDDMKLRSSMTLFARAAAQPGVFGEVLDKFYAGQEDQRTLEILAE